jgi:hypothetical protein
MKRTQANRIILLIISALLVVAGSYYLYRYLRRWAITKIEREQLRDNERIILSFKSLGFEPTSELIKTLESHGQQIEQAIAQRYQNWFDGGKMGTDDQKIDLLVTVNKKMLKSYIRDLQDYRIQKIPTTDTLVKFTYDKMVRLTLALAELKRLKGCGIEDDEYCKKAERMKEITLQSIARSKNSLRDFLKLGLLESDPVVKAERMYLTRKVQDLVVINKALGGWSIV